MTNRIHEPMEVSLVETYKKKLVVVALDSDRCSGGRDGCNGAGSSAGEDTGDGNGDGDVDGNGDSNGDSNGNMGALGA